MDNSASSSTSNTGNTQRGMAACPEREQWTNGSVPSTISLLSIIAGVTTPIFELLDEIDDVFSGCGEGITKVGGSVLAAFVAGVVVEVLLRVQRLV